MGAGSCRSAGGSRSWPALGELGASGRLSLGRVGSPGRQAPALAPFQPLKPRLPQRLGAGWVKLGVSHATPALLPPQHHPWCCWEEGMDFTGIKESS